MRRVAMALAGVVALGCLVPPTVSAVVEIESKVQRITITGRIQPQWSTSTIDDFRPSNEFTVRRARLALRLKLNDWSSGMVEYDLGDFGKAELKDAWFRLSPREGFDITLGQWKRRFDIFELTSSTQILVIERDGRIGRVTVPSLSALTEGLQFSDRDLGAFVTCESHDERLRVEAGISNGAGANRRAVIGEKEFMGRLSFSPLAHRPLEINFAAAARPHKVGGAVADTSEVRYAPAVEGSLEYGKWKSGPHVQAAMIWGKNWNPALGGRLDDSPDFLTFQIIASYKRPFKKQHWFESVEPLFRLCWTDPNNGETIVPIDPAFARFNSGGTVFTPGLNLFILDRTRLSANVDWFVPDGNALDNLTTRPDERDTEMSFKLASWFYF